MANLRFPRLPVSLVLVAVAGLTLVSACGSQATAPPAVTATSAIPSRPLPPAGTILLTGALTSPGQVTVGQLTGMPMQTVQVGFRSGKGAEQQTEVGVPLAQLIPPAALATQGAKNDLLSFAVLGIGADGYQAAVAYGEVSPDFGNTGVLLAVTEDCKALERPRLVVPGDVKGGRYVTDVVELHVSRLTAG